MTLASSFRRRSDIDEEMLPDGSMVLLDVLNAVAYPISESAAAVWRACDGHHTAAAITDRLAVVYDAPREQISRDVDALLRHLHDMGLLETGPGHGR
jgi:hypothetical protein